MRALDLFLISMALGLSILNAATLTTANPVEFEGPSGPDPLAPIVSRNPSFRAIVVHDFDRPHSGAKLPFHWVIGDGASFPDGAVIPTERWRLQQGGSTIDIALGPRHTERQGRSLLELIARLSHEYGIPIDNIGTHRELDAPSRCPQGLDGDVLRGSLLRPSTP